MRRRELITVLACAAAKARAAGGFPQADETLHYDINWPSGLSLGEAQLRAAKGAAGWTFDFTLDAAVPGFAVSDRYRSAATAELCSLEFEKNTAHGKRKTREKTVFDRGEAVARRSTDGGGTTELPSGACARDALDFVYYVRSELARGRVPPPQTVLFGAPYQVTLEFTAAQRITVEERPVSADRVGVSCKGPASTVMFEIFFSRDAARTPLLVRAPFSLGTFSMELTG